MVKHLHRKIEWKGVHLPLQPRVRCCGVMQVGRKPLATVETGGIVEAAFGAALDTPSASPRAPSLGFNGMRAQTLDILAAACQVQLEPEFRGSETFRGVVPCPMPHAMRALADHRATV